MSHATPHPLAGQKVTVTPAGNEEQPPFELEVEDWWDRVAGESWMFTRVPAAIIYARRSGLAHLPIDDQVLYGKNDGLGYLVHESELQHQEA